jgi:hypothetical protein
MEDFADNVLHRLKKRIHLLVSAIILNKRKEEVNCTRSLH